MGAVSDKIIGVILAAGKGTRLYPFSETYPKPILPICNRPLLEYQIERLKLSGISEVLIVIGPGDLKLLTKAPFFWMKSVTCRYRCRSSSSGFWRR